jgi:hypothetical protein
MYFGLKNKTFTSLNKIELLTVYTIMVRFFKQDNYSGLTNTLQFAQLEELMHFMPLTQAAVYQNNGLPPVYVFVQHGNVQANSNGQFYSAGDVVQLNQGQQITALQNSQLWYVNAYNVQAAGLQGFLQTLLQCANYSQAVA